MNIITKNPPINIVELFDKVKNDQITYVSEFLKNKKVSNLGCFHVKASDYTIEKAT